MKMGCVRTIIEKWNVFWFEAERERSHTIRFRIKTFRFMFFMLLAIDLYLMSDYVVENANKSSGFYASKVSWLFEESPFGHPFILSGEVLKRFYEVACFGAVFASFGLMYELSCACTAFTYSVIYCGNALLQYQHYYLLCLILWICIFLNEKNAWVSRLISVQLSIVYAFTALTKITDGRVFFGGTTFTVLSKRIWVHESVTYLSRSLAIDEGMIWSTTSFTVIIVELLLVVLVVVAVRSRSKFTMSFTWLIGMTLHASFQFAGSLRIGFFSLYMFILYWLLIGPVFLIPEIIRSSS